MCKELVKDFISSIDKFDDKTYILSIIIYNAAPAIAGYKPSYLIIFHDKGKRNLYQAWEDYKNFIKKELRIEFYELKKANNSTAVLFYNKDQLSEVLNQDKHSEFLKAYGYIKGMSLQQSLRTLKDRYKKVCPHEIGIFLGYPIDDVIEFIEFPEKKALTFGYWKVYHNVLDAVNTFKKYDEIKEKVMKLIMQGVEPLYIMNNMLN
ncbi:DUF3793 family protein [Clostridium bovifaecis]|uniref:DUF3793 family protein n=1 Tax=Clostridium bovifaecis TaxID=2184719 RepID=A0A6I6ETX5_9CLOT|nr:DUF3793 family protein [Clostridium bovifaecis]